MLRNFRNRCLYPPSYFHYTMTLDLNPLLDLATDIHLRYNLLKGEGRINGKEAYCEGRLDAYRAMSDNIQKQLGLGEANGESELVKTINERFAFRLISKLGVRTELKNDGSWEMPEDGRYIVTCKAGRIINVEEDYEYNRRLREK